MRVASKVDTFIPHLGTLDLWILELFAMYATDGQTDRRTKATLTAPFPTGGGITNRPRRMLLLVSVKSADTFPASSSYTRDDTPDAIITPNMYADEENV